MGGRRGIEPQSIKVLRNTLIVPLYQGATLHNVPSNYHCSGLTNGFGLVPHIINQQQPGCWMCILCYTSITVTPHNSPYTPGCMVYDYNNLFISERIQVIKLAPRVRLELTYVSLTVRSPTKWRI